MIFYNNIMVSCEMGVQQIDRVAISTARRAIQESGLAVGGMYWVPYEIDPLKDRFSLSRGEEYMSAQW